MREFGHPRSEGTRQPSTKNTWNTIKPEPPKPQAFSTRITFFFAVTAIMTALLLITILAYSWSEELSEEFYRMFFLAAGAAVITACAIGYLVSRSLTRPIRRLTNTTFQIRNGDLKARSGVRGNDELGRLGETFDDMATALEKDIKLEHRLTSDVAHELRTPLMAILATVEAMQDGVLPADQERLENVASEARRLSRLVDAMLHLSRLENGSVLIRPAKTDVIAMVQGLTRAQEPLFREQNLRLKFSNRTAREECFAEIDGDMVREALINLLSNAIRYTDTGGLVTMAVSEDREDVVISVTDTGIGIAKEDIPQTFSRFWRSDASRERASGGLGVGLAITKEILDRHNGTISIESELGEGTTFALHFPRRQSGQANPIENIA